MPEDKNRSGRWWDSKLLIAFIVTMGAAVAPTVTLITQSGELDVKQSELQHTITMDMLNLAINTDLTPENQRNALEVLSLVISQENLREWAQQKLDEANIKVKEVDSLRVAASGLQLQRDSLQLLLDSRRAGRPAADLPFFEINRTIDSLSLTQRKIELQLPISEQRSLQQIPMEKSTRQRALPDESGRRRGGR